MKQKPVVGMAAKDGRDYCRQPLFDRARRRAGDKSGPVGDAEDMSVNRTGVEPENFVQDDVGRLATDAGSASSAARSAGTSPP